ncbi:hypothetical protein JFL43_13525 [Viridibacillus sp. YIM B01967]|uniref:Uncharacterized protein n=1 Tax=Viridibacillus soli TaxID=2798301 RepID=A0ABS1H8W9_9BACL|nr:hypothetical protein [Viridibacillus soli]MBK3495859.1 hypothetical protein [Viridibacillus soli]
MMKRVCIIASSLFLLFAILIGFKLAGAQTVLAAKATTVISANFLEYFKVRNSEATQTKYKDGIILLTPDEKNKDGAITLNDKIDFTKDFQLTGAVNIGGKSEKGGGADGIGFAFHQGGSHAIGQGGANLGIGGLKNAIGFKIDTFRNGTKASSSRMLGWEADPTDKSFNKAIYGNSPFGAFVTTDHQGWAAMVRGTNQNIEFATIKITSCETIDCLNPGIMTNLSDQVGGEFKDFTIMYDANTKTMTVKYGMYIWQHSFENEVREDAPYYAFSITASTSEQHNQHEFKIERFTYTAEQ